MNSKKTILIIGVSSFVGSNLAYYLKESYRVVGTYFKNPVNIPGVFTLPCDVTSKEVVDRVGRILKPDVVVYTAGLSSISDAYEFPKVADHLNSIGILNSISMAEKNRAKFCLLSSGFVFSGENTLFNEKDTPMSVTVYGSKMAANEFYIQKTCLNYLILRCSSLYGRGTNPFSVNWFEWVEQKFAEGKPFVCDGVIHTGFMDIKFVGKVLKSCLDDNVTNRLFQVSSRDVMSVFDFAKKYARVFGHDEDIVQKGTWRFPSDFHSMDGENQYYALDTTNLESYLNYPMLSVEDHLQNTKNEWALASQKSSKKKKSIGITYV